MSVIYSRYENVTLFVTFANYFQEFRDPAASSHHFAVVFAQLSLKINQHSLSKLVV